MSKSLFVCYLQFSVAADTMSDGTLVKRVHKDDFELCSYVTCNGGSGSREITELE